METIRPIRESELDELIDLLCAVHNPQGRERYQGYIEGDPTWCPSQTPVVVVGSRIVSTLRIWDRWVHLGSTPVRMGGIGGVTTHPDYRQRGLATRLMEHAAEYMRDDGYDLGLLFTDDPGALLPASRLVLCAAHGISRQAAPPSAAGAVLHLRCCPSTRAATWRRR